MPIPPWQLAEHARLRQLWPKLPLHPAPPQLLPVAVLAQANLPSQFTPQPFAQNLSLLPLCPWSLSALVPRHRLVCDQAAES